MDTNLDDITATLAPKSDQLNADDLIAGPQVYTIERVSKGTTADGDQPVHIHLAGMPGRPWKPCKTVRRVLAQAWGTSPKEWPEGARVELFRDPSVRFGSSAVGGIRIRAMSHLEGSSLKVMATTAKGKREPWEIKRIDGAPKPATKPEAPPTAENIANAANHFADKFGITAEDLEAWLGAPRDDWTREDLRTLKALSADLTSGAKTISEVFGTSEPMPF